MKRFILLVVLVTCVLSLNLFAQNSKPWPKTLLWRISGNGLAKTSYLYGTMHLQDKRIFYFSDSLYSYLEKADGYAMEVDFREIVDSVVAKMLDEEAKINIDKKRLARKAEKKKIIDSLVQNVKLHNDKNSKKILQSIRRDMASKAQTRKEMPTIMDAYFFGIADKKGKWVGGIEDVQDQLSLLGDEFGGELSSEELLAPDAEVAAEMEKMVQAYLAKDLDKIEQYCVEQLSKGVEDKLLTQRNIKMAWRMDSLANVRSMFFAIGAAHLPGEVGVITLLRKKGFQVDPVFSDKKIDPDLYSSALPEQPWIKVEDERKSYTVEMPAEPSQMNVANDAVKMKMLLDVTNLNLYMVGSGMLAKDIDLDQVVAAAAKKRNAQVHSKKRIEFKGMKGIEAVMSSDGYTFKIRYLLNNNIFYVLMVGGQQATTPESKNAKRFLESFVAHEVKIEASKEWISYDLKNKGITVMFPGKPKRNLQLEKAADSAWAFTIYDYIDEGTDSYYALQVRDINPGYFLINDTTYFSSMREGISKDDKITVKDTLFTFSNYPAYFYEGKSQDERIIYKWLIIIRGNRTYNLIAAGANISEDNDHLQKFLSSISLADYQQPSWSAQNIPGGNFRTSAPTLIIPGSVSHDEIDAGIQSMYLSYDSTDCMSYQVMKEVHSPYFWISSDSLYFENLYTNIITSGDTVWSRKKVTNGTLKGEEWIVGKGGTSNLKKIRMLINGDTLYSVLNYIPHWELNNKDKQRFFEDFRVIHEKAPTIFTSKADKLLNDLQSRDSATFNNASVAFESAEFSKRDKRLLEAALFRKYADDTANAYYDQRNVVINHLLKLADGETVKYLQDNYSKLSDDREYIKYDVLDLLARIKTPDSYKALKELLLTNPPKVKRTKELSYWIGDSLPLLHSLYPEILQLSNDSIHAERIIDLTVTLLDSGRINMNMVIPYRKNMLHTADTTLASLKHKSADDYFGFEYQNIVEMVRYFRDDEGDKLLQQYVQLPNMELKYVSAIALLKNDQLVDKKQIEAIAANIEYRHRLYYQLKEMGLQKLFPSKYLTQLHFAESAIYEYAYNSDEEYPEKMESLGPKVATWKGEKKRFYLFRVSFGEDEDTGKPIEYLAVAGPFSMDAKDVDSQLEATNVYLEYDPKKLEELLAAYLKERDQETE